MTRAMDMLTLFMKEEPEDELLRELRDVLKEGEEF